MKTTFPKLTFVIALFLTSLSYSQNTIQPSELDVLIGSWEGSLTYIDYGTNKPFSMPANVAIEKGKNEYQLLLAISYPKETNANSKDKIRLSKDGNKINKIAITSIERLEDGTTTIITNYDGKDNGKKAKIRNIYTLSNSVFNIRKEVKFDANQDWMMRSEYKYKRQQI